MNRYITLALTFLVTAPIVAMDVTQDSEFERALQLSMQTFAQEQQRTQNHRQANNQDADLELALALSRAEINDNKPAQTNAWENTLAISRQNKQHYTTHKDPNVQVLNLVIMADASGLKSLQTVVDKCVTNHEKTSLNTFAQHHLHMTLAYLSIPVPKNISEQTTLGLVKQILTTFNADLKKLDFKYLHPKILGQDKKFVTARFVPIDEQFFHQTIGNMLTTFINSFPDTWIDFENPEPHISLGMVKNGCKVPNLTAAKLSIPNFSTSKAHINVSLRIPDAQLPKGFKQIQIDL